MDYRNGEYYLNEEESRVFLRSTRFPNQSIMDKRDAYLAEIESSLRITHMDDGGILIDLLDTKPIRKPAVSFGQILFYRGGSDKVSSFTWNNLSQHRWKEGRYVLCVAKY